MPKKERYKVVRSRDPMIRQNYVGHTGTKIGEPLGMVHLDFGKHGRQTFHKDEVRRVTRGRSRR